MIYHKKLTKTGALTLTKDIRTRSGIRPGQAVDVEISATGVIIIKKHTKTCFCCGSSEDVVKFVNYEICKRCADKLHKRFERGNTQND